MTTENRVIKKWTQPDNLDLLSGLASGGCTDKQIAERMGISVRSFYNYRKKSPELDEAIQEGKEIVDRKVESALMKAALGGTTTETKITLVYEGGELVRTVKERITREVPPNVLACQTWLFNRQREQWKRNRDNEIAVDDDQSINIIVTRAGKVEPE
jgi:cytidylate kinase